MGVRRKVFYPVAFSAMLFASSAMAKIDPTAFVGVTDYFLKDKSKDMTFYSPTLGAVALESGLIENIRFFGDYEAAIKEGKRDYVNDTSKDPLWNLVKILFPSNNGQLGTVTHSTKNFGKYVKDPKVVALLLNYAKKVEDLSKKSKVPAKTTQQFSAEILQALKLNELELGESTIKNIKKVTNRLLTSIRESIEAEKKSQSPYPRHTTEQVIEAFFCYHFNTQKDIWNLISHLDASIVDKKKAIPTHERYVEKEDLLNITLKKALNFDDLFNLSQANAFSSPTPYTPGIHLPTSGISNFYNRENAQIINKVFPSCVETTMRHMSNLITFDPLSREFNLSYIKSFVEKQETLKKKKNTYFKNYKKYYKYQNLKLANTIDLKIYSLWNTVVGDLPGTHYEQGSNEMSTGFVNLLGTFDTIFSLGLKPFPTIELAEKKKWLEESLQTLFSALNPTHIYTINFNGSEWGKELFGTAKITVKKKFDEDLVKEIFSFDLSVADLDSTVNSLKAPHEFFPFKKSIHNYLSVLKKGTAEESLLLLTPTELQKNIHPFYQLYSQPLSDNASKINLLNMVNNKYESWENFPNFRSALQSALKHVMNSFAWNDSETVKKITPVVLNLLKNQQLKKDIDELIQGLSFNSLSWEDIGSAVKKIPNLKYLSLEKNTTIADIKLTDDFKNLETLDLSHSSVKNIEGLENLSHLKSIDLTGARNLERLSLKGLTNLETLKGLDSLSHLKSLTLDEMSMEEISVEGMTNLETLILSNSSVKTIKGLEKLHHLKYVDLDFPRYLHKLLFTPPSDNPSRLGFLQKIDEQYESMKKHPHFEAILLFLRPMIKNVMNSIDWDDNDIAKDTTSVVMKLLKNPDLKKEISELTRGLSFDSLSWQEISSEVKETHNLKYLNLGKNKSIINIQLTDNFMDLETLSLISSSVKSIEGFKNLSHLRYLNLANTMNLEKISLEGLTNLERLVMYNSSIKSIEGLETSLNWNLRTLILSHSQIEEINGLNHLRNIKSIDLQSSSIKNLTGIGDLKELKELVLQDAKNITSLKFEKDNKDLTINLRGSGIKGKEQIEGFEHLDPRKVTF